jgi:5-methylcytosine-specific restriction protein A
MKRSEKHNPFDWVEQHIQERVEKKKELLKQYDRRTDVSKTGVYSLTRWRKLRAYILDREPLCRMCAKDGKITPATLVDHIKPVGSPDDDWFYDEDNLQPLCYQCHQVKTKSDYTMRSQYKLELGKQIMEDLES